MDGYFRNEAIIAVRHNCSGYRSVASLCTEEQMKTAPMYDKTNFKFEKKKAETKAAAAPAEVKPAEVKPAEEAKAAAVEKFFIGV
jgi:hypothetical protein